jgi:serine protease AprX
MKRSLSRKLPALVAAGALVASLMAVTAGASSPGAGLPVKFDPDILAPNSSGRAIVGFDHDVTSGTIRRLASAGIAQAVRFDTIDAVGVVGPVAAYKAIAGWSDVSFVDDDSRIRFNNYSAKKDTHVDQVRKGAGGLDRKYTGKGVTVAVVDTGIWSPHPDLDDRVVKHLNFEGGWFFDMINDGVYSDQVAEATGNPIDSYGHGTHVAGIVAGTGEAGGPDPDMSGVAPGAKLVNFKIADVHQGVDCTVPCDIGWEMNALVAYEYLIEHRNDKSIGGIDIATNSWSVYEVDSEAEPITLIVDAAARHGIINLFAASNDGCPTDGKTNTVALGPNRLPSVLTIAAAEKSDGAGLGTIASFSSCGPQVDVTAPGVDIWSAMAPSVDGAIGGHAPPGPAENRAYYTSLSGTSMATPHAAGIVALLLEANPKLGFKQIRSILTKTAVDYGPKGFDNSWGYGEIDAFKAVTKAEALR